MRIDPRLPRIRAVIKAAAIKLGVRAGTFRAVAVVSYIRFRAALGEFYKLKSLSDTARISEGENYFAEDYVEPGYVAVPFYINFKKVLSDTATVSDVFSIYLPKSFTDTSTATDAAVLRVALSKSDTVTTSDTTANKFSKVVADLATLADAATLDFSKAASDTASAADTVALLSRLAIIDQPTASDSGSLRMQDYCDFTYFAEDYVGESRVFT